MPGKRAPPPLGAESASTNPPRTTREGPEKGDVDLGNPAHRVPFLLYLPGGSPGVIHRELVRGAATFDVAVAFLAGEVQAHADVSRMLRKSRR